MIRTRKRFTIAATTNWETEAITVPAKLIVKRVRAVVKSPGTQVALQIREAEAGEEEDIPLEYSLATGSLDSEEDVYVEALTAKNRQTGTIWIAVKSNTACNVVIILEYEANA